MVLFEAWEDGWVMGCGQVPWCSTYTKQSHLKCDKGNTGDNGRSEALVAVARRGGREQDEGGEAREGGKK
jgi:hypothetical protein